MPLSITDGIPITPQAPPPLVHLPLGSLNEVLPLPDAETSHVLEINAVQQEKKEWCWAACMQMVLAKLEQQFEQCAILAKTFGLNPETSCLVEKKEALKNKSLSAKKMKAAWAAFGIEAEEHLGTALDDKGRILFDAVPPEILNERPIEVAVSWFGGGSHAFLIKGFGKIGDEPIVWINDPLLKKSHFTESGEGPILFSELITAHNYGVWVCTWTGLGKSDV